MTTGSVGFALGGVSDSVFKKVFLINASVPAPAPMDPARTATPATVPTPDTPNALPTIKPAEVTNHPNP